MSLAVFTDSTTAQVSPAFSWRPTVGSSTNTTSVSSCCAWSVMPTVATSPARRTHSWDLAYLRSAGTCVLMGNQLSGVLAINRFGHHFGGRAASADFDFNW